jgi:hypothetical protein
VTTPPTPSSMTCSDGTAKGRRKQGRQTPGLNNPGAIASGRRSFLKKPPGVQKKQGEVNVKVKTNVKVTQPTETRQSFYYPPTRPITWSVLVLATEVRRAPAVPSSPTCLVCRLPRRKRPGRSSQACTVPFDVAMVASPSVKSF